MGRRWGRAVWGSCVGPAFCPQVFQNPPQTAPGERHTLPRGGMGGCPFSPGGPPRAPMSCPWIGCPLGGVASWGGTPCGPEAGFLTHTPPPPGCIFVAFSPLFPGKEGGIPVRAGPCFSSRLSMASPKRSMALVTLWGKGQREGEGLVGISQGKTPPEGHQSALDSEHPSPLPCTTCSSAQRGGGERGQAPPPTHTPGEGDPGAAVLP